MHVGKGIKWMQVGRPPFVKKTWAALMRKESAYIWPALTTSLSSSLSFVHIDLFLLSYYMRHFYTFHRFGPISLMRKESAYRAYHISTFDESKSTRA